MPYLKSILVGGFLFLATTVAAQSNLYLEPRLNFGTFRMRSMKELQEGVIRQTGVNAKATEKFGAYYQYGFGLVKDLDEQTRVGLFVEHGSTGGRVAYEDYSGEVRFDTPMNYNALGATIYTHEPIHSSSLNLLAGIELNALFTSMRVESLSRLYDESEWSEEKFNATGLGIKPFVGLQYPVSKAFVNVSLGYLANLNGPFHVPGDIKQYLVRNSKGDKLEPSWSGVRISCSLSLPIHALKL